MAVFENTGKLDLGGLYSAGLGVRPAEPAHWSEVTVVSVFHRYPWMITALMLVLAYYVFESIVARASPPVSVLSAQAMQDTVKAGGDVQIKFVVTRREICENSIMSYWTDRSGAEVMRLPLRSRTVPKLGENLPVFVTVPAPDITGNMCYQSTVVHRCPDGNVAVVTPPVCVLVVP